MKYGINYLTEVVELLNEKKIDVDYVKYPSVNNTSIEELNFVKNKTKKDVLFHGLIIKNGMVSNILSPKFIEGLDMEKNIEAIKISNTPGISIHLGNDCIGEAFDEYDEKELLNILYKNIDYVKSNFINSLEFLEIENRQNATNLMTLTPQFISKALEVADCKFLLDISHAVNAASLLGTTYSDYIERLPLSRINETHINGWRFEENFLSHIEMVEEGYDILKYLAKNTNVKIVTLEYGVNSHMLKFTPNIPKEKLADVPVAEIGKVNENVKKQIIRQMNRIREICE